MEEKSNSYYTSLVEAYGPEPKQLKMEEIRLVGVSFWYNFITDEYNDIPENEIPFTREGNQAFLPQDRIAQALYLIKVKQGLTPLEAAAHVFALCLGKGLK